MIKKEIESPFANCNAKLNIAKTKRSFRKEEFDVYEYYYVCEETKKDFATNESTDLTLKQLYNQYRERHKILFPLQIKQLREKYGLSAIRMSEVLGFGENVYRQYEKGEIPNKSNANFLNLMKHSENFIELAQKSETISDIELAELNKTISFFNEKNDSKRFKKYLRNYSDEIDQFTGYVLRYYKKFANMIIFFLKQNDRAFTTRLNKYLFYSDFIAYKYTGSSISGYNYCALEKGPVPDNYKQLFYELWQENYVENIEQQIGKKETEKFVPAKEFDSSIFNEDELEIIKYISDNFKFKKTEELIKLSHREKGWIENISEHKTISYQEYAPLLNL